MYFIHTYLILSQGLNFCSDPIDTLLSGAKRIYIVDTYMNASMRVATGGDGGDMSPPPVRNSGGMSTQKSRLLKKILYIFVKIFRFANIF